MNGLARHLEALLAERVLLLGVGIDEVAREGQRARVSPQVIELVDRLQRASAEFAEWWPQLDVAQFQTRVRRYHHHRAGDLAFEYQQLTHSEWPHLRVVVQLPLPDDDSAARLSERHRIA